jgi:GT2 family glycosyltransferase
MSGVCAVVVTHNRKELLGECLRALAAQRRPPDRVLVVDNASSDGTRAMLDREFERVDVLPLPRNVGGAGGFHEGLKLAHRDGADWIWLMDDDTMPAPDALAELLLASERLEPGAPPSLLVSRVEWRDGRLHPMNAPWPDRRPVEPLIKGAALRLVPLREATFVSLLLHRGAVDRHGLPLKQFFLWSDDIEYTSRILASGEAGYLVPASVALHKTETPHTAAFAAPDRFYFHVRNTIFILRGPGRGWRERLARGRNLVSSVAAYLVANPHPASVAAVLRGLRDGVRTGLG